MKTLNRLDRELIRADKMNTDVIRVALAEMATESIPMADYEGIRGKLFSSKKNPAFSRRYIQLAVTAACAAVIMLCVLCVWTLPGLFIAPNNPGEIVADGNTIIPGEPGESFGTDNDILSDADTIIPGLPDEVWYDEEPIEPGSMFVFTNAYETLSELHTLLEQSDANIEEYLLNHPNYSMNGLLTRTDIETLFAIINKSQFPFIAGVKVDEVLVVPEAGRVYSRFVVDGIVYGFTSERDYFIQDMIDEGNIELLNTTDNISLYFLKRTGQIEYGNSDNDLLPFIMDVRGVYVHVLVNGAADLQTAVDGILAFGFGSFINENEPQGVTPPQNELRNMTLADVRTLAAKGLTLTEADLEPYYGTEGMTGLYFAVYLVDGGDYVLGYHLGDDENGLFTLTQSEDLAEGIKGIDIRYYDIDKYIADGTRELVRPLPEWISKLLS